MTEMERCATIGTWERVFKEEGYQVDEMTIRNRLKSAGVIGMMGRDRIGRVLENGFYPEVAVREACHDLLHPLNAEYCNNAANLQADFWAFARELGEGKMPEDLNTGNMLSLSISCQNGVRAMGMTYIRTVARSLGLVADNTEAGSKQAELLRSLLKKAGFKVMEKTVPEQSYYCDSAVVCADLLSFASQLKGRCSPIDLRVHNMRFLTILREGQPVTGQVYLRDAAEALNLAHSNKEAKRKEPQALEALLMIAGFQPFNQKYFNRKSNLQADFLAFAKKLGEGKTPRDLSTRNIHRLSARCINGMDMNARRYFKKMAVLLGWCASTQEAESCLASVLERALEKAGL